MEILIISPIALGSLKNAEHVQLHTNVRNVINAADAESIGLTEVVWSPYRTAIAEEQDIVNKAMGSPYTLEMQEADKERDIVFKRCHRKLELCELENRNSEAYKAMPVVKKHLLGKYSYSVPGLPYQEETATITGFIQDCRALLTAEQLEGIGIDSDLEELQMVNKKFSQMYQERVAEKAAGDTQLSVKLRAVTDEAYQRLCIALNALANDADAAKAEQTTACRDAVQKINVVIRDAKNRLAQRFGGASAVPSDGTVEETGAEAEDGDGESIAGVSAGE